MTARPGPNPVLGGAGVPISDSNRSLISEYLDIMTNAPEDLERTLRTLTNDCVWRLTPPGIEFRGKEQLRSFVKMAMASRSHRGKYRIAVRNCFTDGERLCIEYFHGALATRLRIRVVENVCLVCHMQDGKFNWIHEYVDTSGSMLVGFGLRILPLLTKGERSKPVIRRSAGRARERGSRYGGSAHE